MSIQQISPNSIAANPAYVNPQVKTDQNTAAPQVNHDAEKAVQATKTDTVTISQQALQKLASDNDSAAQEAKETVAEKTGEALQGKK